MNEATLRFAREHADDDVRQLALKGSRDADVDMTAALQQIAGRQTARRKLPSWAAIDGLLYPPHLSLEQCSSEATARYKAEVARRACSEELTLIDLTGGFGVDFSFMARGFTHAIYVERQAELCALARHNLPLLGLPQAEVVNSTAEDFLASPPSPFHKREGETDMLWKGALLFLDPARRSSTGQRTYAISDCTPDVLQMLPQMMTLCPTLLLKLSPMLDWHKAVSDIEGAAPCHVAEVHVVATDGECKELLLLVKRGEATAPLAITCVEGERMFRWSAGAIETIETDAIASIEAIDAAGKILLVPGASVMKAGCFRELEQAFGISQLADNSHLFISNSVPEQWPGRSFSIVAVTSMNKRETAATAERLRQQMQPSSSGPLHANVAVRNFPLTADELKKRLKTKDGGRIYIFATTLGRQQHVLLWCEAE